MIIEGQQLWQPSETFAQNSNVSKYITWLNESNLATCKNFNELWQWSVSDLEAFWASLWKYFDIISDTGYESVTDSIDIQPGNNWFIGSKINLAEHILRNEHAGAIAIYHMSEIRKLDYMTWDELGGQVRILTNYMRDLGLRPGDAVCCIMPSIPETVIAMLATISAGAVWSNVAPDFGCQTILDRFTQIKPKWLFVADGYQFGGKTYNRHKETKKVVSALASSLEHVIYLPYLNTATNSPPVAATLWRDALSGRDPGPQEFVFERVAHDHPLWVLFTSGTTGPPKAIVHNHAGALIEMLKTFTFHCDLNLNDTAFFYASTGWVIFNMQVMMLLTGARIVLYDGNPAWPQKDLLWSIAEKTKASLFGASPPFIQMMERLGVKPGESYDLSQLRCLICSGSPASPDVFKWLYDNIKKDLWVASQSGGTEILCGFVASSPTLPVYAGEIQTRALGMDVQAYDEHGGLLVNEVGELVCRKPFPSMPMYFLNDPDFRIYQEAYFDDFPGVWTHGDFIKFNERGGSYIYGRSDSTLNRNGVRIGTSELYRTVESLPEIDDSLVVCIELPDGKFFMPMFLQLAAGLSLTEALKTEISEKLRKHCSPRHIPDKYIVVDEVPYTLTGKKLEVPVRKLLLGWPIEKAISRSSMKNPQALDFFLMYATTKNDYQVTTRF